MALVFVKNCWILLPLYFRSVSLKQRNQSENYHQAENLGLAWPGPGRIYWLDGSGQAKFSKFSLDRRHGLPGHQAPSRHQARPAALLCILFRSAGGRTFVRWCSVGSGILTIRFNVDCNDIIILSSSSDICSSS